VVLATEGNALSDKGRRTLVKAAVEVLDPLAKKLGITLEDGETIASRVLVAETTTALESKRSVHAEVKLMLALAAFGLQTNAYGVDKAACKGCALDQYKFLVKFLPRSTAERGEFVNDYFREYLRAVFSDGLTALKNAASRHARAEPRHSFFFFLLPLCAKSANTRAGSA
jgi:hypothetical protein